jgi:crotonobetainyl-CoA:carnitine CoA-transferase CaiB-like acyl-CoA transferase
MDERHSPFAAVAFDPARKGPLDGVRVLDLSRLVAGNMLSLQLGDLGAEVMKVEPPRGDPLREWRDDGEPMFWKTYARNKRSLELDLRVAEAREALLRLVVRADVLIENYPARHARGDGARARRA